MIAFGACVFAPLNQYLVRKDALMTGEKSYPKFCMYEGGSISPDEAERRWVMRLCQRAVPEARSEAELCERISEAMPRQNGRRPHPRTVRNWVRGDNKPSMTYTMALIALAGAETIFWLLDPERDE